MELSSHYGLRSSLAFLRFGVADVHDLTVRDLSGGTRGPARLVDRTLDGRAHCLSRVPLAFHDPEDRVIDRLFNESPTNEEAMNLIRPHNWRAEKPVTGAGKSPSALTLAQQMAAADERSAAKVRGAAAAPPPRAATKADARADEDGAGRSVSDVISTTEHSSSAADHGLAPVAGAAVLPPAQSSVSSTRSGGGEEEGGEGSTSAKAGKKKRRRTTIIRFRGSVSGGSAGGAGGAAVEAAAAVAAAADLRVLTASASGAEAAAAAAAARVGAGAGAVRGTAERERERESEAADRESESDAAPFAREAPAAAAARATAPALASSIAALLRPVTGNGVNEGDAPQRVRPARQGDTKYTIYLPERKFRAKETNAVLSFELITFKRNTVSVVLGEILEEYRIIAPTLVTQLSAVSVLALRGAAKLQGDASCYQLAMHEEDGMPDNDMPELNLSSTIGGLGDNEFCLREIGEKIAALAAKQGVESNPRGGLGGGFHGPGQAGGGEGAERGGGSARSKLSLSRRISKLGGASRGKVIQVRDTCSAGGVRTFAVTEGLTVQGIINKLRDRRGMFMFAAPFELRLKPADMQRLSHVLDRLDAGTDLTSLIELGVEQLYAFPREFADSKDWKPRAHGFMLDVGAARREHARKRGGGNGSGEGSESSTGTPTSGHSLDSTYDEGLEMAAAIADDVEYKRRLDRPRPEEFELQHTEHTLSIYQEWEVVKINDRGKRQKRMLGVDSSSVYNRKLEKAELGMWGGFGGGTRRPVRNIDDIKDIGFDDDVDEIDEGVRSRFHITFRDDGSDAMSTVLAGGRDAVLRYDALCSETAAYIVHKIKFIMDRSVSGLSRSASVKQMSNLPPGSH